MEELIKKRTTAKRAITKVETYINTNIRANTVDANQFKIREEHLMKAYENYDGVQAEIEHLDESLASDRDSIEEQYFSMLARIRVYTVPPTVSNLSARIQSVDMQNIKLPNIRTPTFSGKYEEWSSFYELFKALIDEKELTNVQKFVYLKSSLTGEPHALVNELELTSENYIAAKQLLKDRYHNNLVTINRHLKKLYEVKSLEKGEASALREFCSSVRQHVNALKSLKLPVKEWDVLLVFLLAQKLDFQTRKAYELEKSSTELPELEPFLKFLEKRCTALESIMKTESSHKSRSKVTHVVNHSSNVKNNNCIHCSSEEHSIYKCNKFIVLSDTQKRQFIVEKRLCYNCLRADHGVKQCKSRGCSICNKKHHTLLHMNSKSEVKIGSLGAEGPSHGNSNNAEEQVEEKTSLVSKNNNAQILLATAKVLLTSQAGIKIQARALLDSASQVSFITSEMVNRLKLKISKQSTIIGGIGHVTTQTKGTTELVVESLVDDSCKLNASFAVLTKITGILPHSKIDTERLIVPPNVKLADPQYDKPAKLDLLIGADLYFELLSPGLIKLGPNLPTLQNSQLGWLIAGNAPTNSSSFCSTALVCSTLTSLEETMSKFYQLEEVADRRALSFEERKCEDLFKESVQQLENGQFQVDLPLRDPESHRGLGNSFLLAKKRFLGLEKRLKKDGKLFLDYKKFIDEYVELGHGKYVDCNENFESIRVNRCFLPHHCVIREASSSTKLRVVFDASMKTNSGLSLNEILLKGYNVQPELFEILCRFRTFRFAMTADIQKMYRIVKINPNQLFLQNILWRENPNQNLKCIELQTVTYGTKPAAFLATRTLKYLAESNLLKYPLASKAIMEQCYMDDFLCGSDSLEESIELKNQLIELLNSGGFMLHKWCSNTSADVDIGVPHEKHIESEAIANKVLGITWDSSQDRFHIRFSFESDVSCLTKRIVLSQIASIFDPLGLVSPVVIIAKMFMQRVWSKQLSWDEELPKELAKEWRSFVSSVLSLKEVQVPRSLYACSEIKEIQLHGFSDASVLAYGACVYLRVLYSNGVITSNLICSKSRVAPLKAVTLPRLELCGGLLLARLVHKLKLILFVDGKNIHLWTDSRIVLCWLSSSSSKWQTFVANRVAEIQELTTRCNWQHIKSAENPADLISRGTTCREKINSSFWWNGPKILLDHRWLLPKYDMNNVVISEAPEQKRVVCTLIKVDPVIVSDRFSSFSRLKRTVAFLLRFLHNIRQKKEKLVGGLSAAELRHAVKIILLLVQKETFCREINSLKLKEKISQSSIACLNPFCDHDGLLRVNGRLTQADIDYDQKFPVLLPAKHRVVNLLIKYEHCRLLHAGVQSTLSQLRANFWIVNGLREVKHVLKGCIICHRLKAQAAQQLMGSLPSERVNIARAFLKVGIDFGGPITIRSARIRGAAGTKAYIALFVCLVTKAIHLELVSSLSTEAFLQTLKRFISRRGNPRIIYSDNATNFKGANNQLREVFEFFRKRENPQEITEFLSESFVEWKFIPPNSPHWGGLWEAGIKSTKQHLHKIVGNSILTFEEISTVLSQIEAILNSRPLCPISSDPADLACLTPSHFLIGEPLTTYPEADISEVSENKLSHWEKCTKLQQSFWKRWSKDYLNRLQNRPKWIQERKNLQIDDVVLIKDDNLAPLKWNLGRITEVFPGSDNRVRVVKLRTKEGVFTRPISKLCPLPFENN